MALRWYVVHAYSNFEHRVAEALKERIKRDGLESKFGEILVPTEEVVEVRDDQKHRGERKFYPGYVLVPVGMNRPLTSGARRAQGARLHRRYERQAGADNRKGSAQDSAAGRGRCRSAAAEGAFEPGQVVRVVHGPFNDFNGVVESVNCRRTGCRWQYRFSAARRRWNWISRRSRRSETDDWGASRRWYPKDRSSHGKEGSGLHQAAVPAGSANPSPPIGPALGQQGVNMVGPASNSTPRQPSSRKGCQFRR